MRPDELVGREFAGLRFEALLSGGRIGTIYRAVDLTSGQVFAVKRLPHRVDSEPEALARLAREFRTTRGLSHPNLVSNLRLETDGANLYLVMEYVEGRNVVELLQQGPLPGRSALEIGGQIAGALGYLHERSIVHRDVKPSNILVRPDGTAKLADLELVKDLSTRDAARITGTGTILGTPGFLAPECAIDGRPTSPASDVYALGVTLFAMFTARLPFAGQSAVEVYRQQRAGIAPGAIGRPGGLPDVVGRWVAAVLHPDPGRRPSCRELGAGLASVLGSGR